MRDSDHFFRGFPAAGFAAQHVFQLRELLGPVERFDMPSKPGPVILFAAQSSRRAVNDGLRFPIGQAPIVGRVKPGRHPRFQQRKRL